MRLTIKHLNYCPYDVSHNAMKRFTDERNSDTPDELWLLEHPPVFTQGQAGKAEHILAPGNIPIIQTDRGGQITYHGPGQLMGYLLADLRRLHIGPRALVQHLENTVIHLMAELGVEAYGKRDAPGVYIGDKKLCSIGLRVRKGCSYHGIALNVNMDLTPFNRINPCGYQGLKMTQISDYWPEANLANIQAKIIPHLLAEFDYEKP